MISQRVSNRLFAVLAVSFGLISYGQRTADADLNFRFAHANDAEIVDDGSVQNANSASMFVGLLSDPGGTNGILVIDLGPIVPNMQMVDSAVLTVNQIFNLSETFNIDLYGVGFGTTPTIQTSPSLWYAGANDGNYTKVMDDFSISDPVGNNNNGLKSTSGTGLLDYLQDAQTNSELQRYAFFRMSPNQATFSGDYRFDPAEGGTPPVLTLNIIPEPGSAALLGLLAIGIAAYSRRRKI